VQKQKQGGSSKPEIGEKVVLGQGEPEEVEQGVAVRAQR
jgi:hypothetical protein